MNFRHRNQFSLDVSCSFRAIKFHWFCFLWPGVVFSKGMVFINIWVKILQGILWNIFRGHDFVIANNIQGKVNWLKVLYFV
uniref:Putative signal transducer and activator of transcription 1-alpha/beta n=1 Tax=Ixodes ricinus TaxID=34613 RepID=A0A0K8REI8_IXORI